MTGPASGIGALSRALFLVCFAVLLAAVFVSAAHAAEAVAKASEQDGYGRLVLTFDTPPGVETRISGGVLIVAFSDAVGVNIEPIAAGLPNFISAARRDPDGRALRFALSRPAKVNTMAAGEKLFVDLMPETWVGMPPPLPPDVVADLSRRALAAEEAKRELARAQTLPPVTMQVSAGTNEERMRLTFSFSDKVEVRFKHDDHHGVLTVPASVAFDAALARAALPPDITDFKADIVGETLVVRFSAPEGREMRGLHEGRAFAVDIVSPEKNAAADSASEMPAAFEKAEAEIEGKLDLAGGAAASVQVEPEKHAAASPPPSAPPAVSRASQPDVPEPAPDLAEQAEGLDVLLSASERAMRDLAKAAEKDGVQVRIDGTTTHIAFPFAALPAAAAFEREKMLFVVFDGKTEIDAARIVPGAKGLVSSAETIATGAGTALRLALAQSRLVTLASYGQSWILSLGDTIMTPSRPVHLKPAFEDDGRTSLRAQLEGVGTVHLVPDDRIGDELFVVTLKAPARGIVREQNFIEFAALRTVQGLAFQPRADDFQVKASANAITLTRARGLTLSLDAVEQPLARTQLEPGSPFAAQAWHEAQVARVEKANELSRSAAAATPEERTTARLQLAKFHLANGNAAETKAILDVAASESPGLSENPDVRLMRGTSLVMLRRFDEAVKVLGAGGAIDTGEAALWRMVAEAGLGHIAFAREAFRKGEAVLGAMPAELQRTFRQTMIEVAVAAKDYAAAAVQLDALDTLNVADGWPMREVMRGRIAEGFEQPAIALEAYRRAIESGDERAMAEARLRATNLRYELADIARKDAIENLEGLAAYWRGDSTEAVTLASLARLYKEENRWRDAFTAMRAATSYHAAEPSTLAIQDEMTAEFARLFLAGGEDAAPPTLETVALFYDFKELTPPGRKGDALIRNLADRLVQVDLLAQAADLLTYQVNNRLQGPARAQVAAHVAAIELMDRKPGRALNVLHDTRFAGLAPDVVRGRLILEARALSELHRPDLALEMIAAYDGADIDRLRADILWAAQRWQSAAEALEVMLGESWQTAAPLDDGARQGVLRASIAYALAEDALGLDRLRTKFSAKMAETPDRRTFDVVTAPANLRGDEFARVARAVSVADTLKKFLEDYRARYPQTAPPVVRMKEDGVPGRTAEARAL